MITIGLIAAMVQEIKPLLRRAGKYEKFRLGAFSCYQIQLPGKTCLVIESGIGQKRAMNATRTLLSEGKPDLLFSFGVAGAAQTGLNVGDVVEIEQAYTLEDGIPVRPQPLATLSTGARSAAARILKPLGVSLSFGVTITTPGPQVIRQQPENLKNPLLEMETAGIATMAAQQGIPLLALRAVSDTPAQPLPFSIEEFTDSAYNLRVGRLLVHLLCHPAAISSLLRFNRNVSLAAENLGAAILAVLDQTNIIDNVQ